MENSGWNMYVFRDGRRNVPGQRLVSELRDRLAALEQGRCLSQDGLLDALIAAGELECALTDAGSEAAVCAAALSDAVAAMLVSVSVSGAAKPSENNRFSVRPLLAQLESFAPSQPLCLSVHEGFAYYALHPLKIVDLLRDVLAEGAGGSHFAVLGIRSIGATLSAVLVAALRTKRVRRRTHHGPAQRPSL